MLIVVPASAVGLPGARSAAMPLPPTVGRVNGLPMQESARAPRPGLGPYRGVAVWIDMFNRYPWDHPHRVVRRMAARNVRTLFLQTSNYEKRNPLFRPRALARFVDAAHAHGMAVVAWYVPNFKNHERDLRRTMAAIRFETGRGHGFDSFAMDIEATKVASIGVRNRRLLTLSAAVRRKVGPHYALGAIVPEAGANYWPGLPYRQLARHYDVFLPMAYFTFRTTGAARVYDYAVRNVRTIRRAAGRDARVHPIGGIAGESPRNDVAAFLRGARSTRAIGASLYDYPITTDAEWRLLRRHGRLLRG